MRFFEEDLDGLYSRLDIVNKQTQTYQIALNILVARD